MIVDEAHIAMSLHHGNIVQVLDLVQARGRYFLALELVDGWDLASVISRADNARLPVGPGLSLYIVAQVCRALAYAHGQTRDGKALGIVHRDISPQNVLVSEQGEVKLTDFGIAKALGKRERTQTGVIKGKLDFMSPEQAAGAPLDARSDIFSVGTLLYLLATGKRPFEADGQLETLIRVQNAQFTPPEEADPSLSRRIGAVVRKAMQKVPSERYASAEEMLRDVEQVLRGDFQSVGQSELKTYLERLGRKDNVPSISRAPGLPQEEEAEEAEGPTARAAEGELGAEPTAPEGRRPPPFSNGMRTGRTLALDATVRRPTPEAAGALPARPVIDDSTDFVAQKPPSRIGRALMVVVTLALAGVAGAMYLLSPQTGKKLLDEGRQQLARTGLPLPGDDKPPTKEGENAPREPARKTERAAEPARPVASEDRPPRPGAVTLRLTSRPDGATVHTKAGGKLGKTPMSLTFKPGSVQVLKFTKSGYETTSRRITVGESNTSIVVDLDRLRRRR
jgi:hypothetical protein